MSDRPAGQSLVEVALFFPLLIFLLAAAVDVAALARQSMYLTHVTNEINRELVDQMDMDRALERGLAGESDLRQYEWDIYVMIAKIDPAGTAWLTATVEHVYGFFMVHPDTPAWPVGGFLDGSSPNLILVGVAAYRDRQPGLLRLLWDSAGVSSVGARSVYRALQWQ